MNKPVNSNEEIAKLEELEKGKCNMPLIFAEMFKDEINATDEQRLYNGVKRMIRKYSPEKKDIEIINEYTRVITGGTSLEEIIRITIDEALNPSLASEIIINNSYLD